MVRLEADVRPPNPIIWPSHWSVFASGTTAQLGTVAWVHLTYFWVPRQMTISKLILGRLSTGGGAGTSLRLGLYADNGGTPAGGALLADSGNIDASTVGTKEYTLATPLVLSRGLYWFALETENGTMAFWRNSSVLYWTDVGSEMLLGCYYALPGPTFGALTNPCPAVAQLAVNAVSFFRVDSIDE